MPRIRSCGKLLAEKRKPRIAVNEDLRPICYGGPFLFVSHFFDYMVKLIKKHFKRLKPLQPFKHLFMWILIAQRMILDFLLHIIYFPLWWYTGGLKHVFLYCVEMLRTGNSYLVPGLWLKNIFVPMFGQSDWQGRIVSVFMRFINVIGRSVGLFIWFIFVFILFLLWIVWPVFTVFMLMKSI